MAYKSTVAIIGATSPLGETLAKASAHSYRLLLMDNAGEGLRALQTALGKPEGEVEILQCCKEASWEADAVVVAVDDEKLPEVAGKIKVVTTCKPVVHFTTAAQTPLADLLPYAHVITVWLDKPVAPGTPPQSAFLKGHNNEALSFAQSLLTALGCSQKAAAQTR